MDKEDGLNHCEYESHKESVDTCRELYKWWKENKKTVSINDDIADEMLIKLIGVRGFLWT